MLLAGSCRVSGFPRGTSTKQLEAWFADCGAIAAVTADQARGNSAVIEFKDPKCAYKAANLHGTPLPDASFTVDRPPRSASVAYALRVLVELHTAKA